MADEGGDPPPRTGQIVSFYSFKRGTGRTMALANVAWILAANGKRVLIADWDLDSPGLHRFFQPFLDARAGDRPGIVDVVRRYTWAMSDAQTDPGALDQDEPSRQAVRAGLDALVDEHVSRLDSYAVPLSWEFPDGGALYFLSPGKQADGDYQATLSSLDWDNFYEILSGARFLDAVRTFVKSRYDYVLIDSQPGRGDVADICVVHLPDTVIDCFTLASQGIDGAAMTARAIGEHSGRSITVLPVPMRIDHAHKDKVAAGLDYAMRMFEGLPAGMPDEQRRGYWAAVQVPYRPAYAYEETLAAFYDRPGDQDGLLPHYERIAGLITAGEITTLPPREEWVRLRTRLRFARTQSSNQAEVVLDFSPQDQLWAEWIGGVLASAEITVCWADEIRASREGTEKAETVPQAVAIVSESYATRMQDSPTATLPDLLISVTEARVPAALAEVPIVLLAGLPEGEAANTLIDLFSRSRPAGSESPTRALTYPGGDRTQVQNIPARNPNFTGRDRDLRQLRELRARSMAVFQPLTLLGVGGVGKTQVALEYAHRFRADYDIIWWMNCGQAQYVDASLADLGEQLRVRFASPVSEEGGVTEVCQQTLRTLGEGLPGKRWLLIYDNAEEMEQILPLVPAGGGHILITSRNEQWQDIGASLEVDTFLPGDSVSHLRRRLPGMTEADAGKIAAAMGNLPLAVEAAGALLAATGMPADEYLARLERQQARTYPAGYPLYGYPPSVAAAWYLSLDELETRSPAAAWLLGICSVMAPQVSADLIYSEAMAETLRALDPAISEQSMIARLIRLIDLLALITVDNNGGQIQVQHVVQDFVSSRMSEGETAAARRVVHQMMVNAMPEGDVGNPQTWLRCRAIWPHLRPSMAMWSPDARVRQLLIERVRYLRQRDDLERGKRRAEEIQRAWRSMLSGTPDPEFPESAQMVKGEPDPEAADTLRRQLLRLQFSLANILRDLAEFGESRRVDQEVLEGQIDLLGPEHPHTLQTRGSVAADLRALGDYQAALDLDTVTYESWREVFGDEFRGTLDAANNLALSYLLTGRFRQALALDQSTLERRTLVFGPSNPRTLSSGAAVARDLLEAGRYAEAVSRIKMVWGRCAETLGYSDRTTLNAQLLLGVALRCAGHPDEATGHIERARSGLTQGFGHDSPDALAARLSQALNLLAMGHHREARDTAEQVLAVYENRLGNSHPHSLICRADIAALCIDEDLANARTEAETAASGLQEKLGDDHPYTLAAQMVVATVLARQGHLATARNLEEQVVIGREQVLGRDHPDTLRCRANLLLTEQELGIESAAEKRQEVLAELGGSIGPGHPDLTTALRQRRVLSAIDTLPY